MTSWLSSALTPLQWILLAAIPPAIVLLYFLKLKRMPLEVPSTYLWSRTIEDLHVNSIWQRLRQSLLLLLQLLLIALIMLALIRPFRTRRASDVPSPTTGDSCSRWSGRSCQPIARPIFPTRSA